MRLHTTQHTRSGFTLVELIVVIGLMLLLVGISVSISYSGLIDNYKTVGAGDRASGWLLIAKSKAQREGAPRGVRFLIGPGNLIKEAQYIEVPDPYVPRSLANDKARIRLTDDGMGNRTATILGTDLVDLAGNVEAGDTLSLPEYGVIIQINAAIPTTGASAGVLTVNAAFLPQLGSNTQAITTAFGFLRKARPMLGEPILLLTGDTCIDATQSSATTQQMSVANITTDATGTFFIDVLFAPNGEVLNTTSGKTILWVRNDKLPKPRPTVGSDSRIDYEAAGTMNLVTIYTKTGQIATQPITLPSGSGVINHNPYAATQDGFNTGL